MNRFMPNFLILLTQLLITGCRASEIVQNSKITGGDETSSVTNSVLVVLVDASYKISHGWGHVFECRIKEGKSGELEDTLIFVSVYGTVILYDNLLLPFKSYENLMLSFILNPEGNGGPPPGFRDSKGNYWDLLSVSQSKDLFITLIPNTIYQYFPDLAGFDCTIATYAYDSFPPLRYQKPEPEEWSKGLKATSMEDSSKGFVKVWRKEGRIEYIWITEPYPDGGEFYAFDGDTVNVLSPVNLRGFLFMTEVGITRWEYRYKNNLLHTITYCKLPASMSSSQDIWAQDRIEYWPGTDVPGYIYRYEEPEDLDVPSQGWASRTVHDRKGMIIRKEDSAGKVWWEKKPL